MHVSIATNQGGDVLEAGNGKIVKTIGSQELGCCGRMRKKEQGKAHLSLNPGLAGDADAWRMSNGFRHLRWRVFLPEAAIGSTGRWLEPPKKQRRRLPCAERPACRPRGTRTR